MKYLIPHSEFLGWAKDDRDKAIWQYLRDKQRCPRCGTRAEEWHESKGGHRDAYKPVVDLCPGCECKESFEKNLDPKALPRGSYVTLRKLRGR